MADAPDCHPTEFSYPLGEHIDRFENCGGLLVKEQVIVAESRSGEMPVKVLRLDIERECISDERVDGVGNRPHTFGFQIGGRCELP
jgi:hypothetical protein